jgi:hypothetical protein
MADHCAYLGAFDDSEAIYAQSLYFFRNTNREMPEFIVNAYRCV